MKTPLSNSRNGGLQVNNDATELHGLFTPESTPGPENARIEADKERRTLEAIKIARIEAETNRPQKKTTKELSNQSHSQQALNKEHLIIEIDQFAENAQEDENSDYDNNMIMLETSDASKSNDFRRQIYKAVEPFLATLMMSSDDAEAITRLKHLNEQIQKQNVKKKKNFHDFFIKYETFIVHFLVIKFYYEILQKNSNNENAREKLMIINETLNELNKRHDYFKIWMITIPFRIIDEVDKVFVKNDVKVSVEDDVKIKINIRISNESNDQTFFEHVVAVKKAEYDLRVIVNRDTQKIFFFEIYFETEFEKKIVNEWLTTEIYNAQNLSKNITTKQMIIFERVKIKKIKKKRAQFQFYLIRVENQEYVIVRSTFFKMQSAVKLQRIDKQLDIQYLQLRDELDRCRNNNEHSNIEKSLINADIELMPWLSSYEISRSENEKNYDNENKNDDIEILIPQKTDLQRSSSVESEIWARLWKMLNEQ